MLLKINDTVRVISGSDKGKTGKILKINYEEGKIVVEGVGRVWKHVRKSQRNPRGGRLSKEMPISASNVMLVDPSSGTVTRLGVRYLKDGGKERYAKKSGKGLGLIGKAKPARAAKAVETKG